MMHSYNTFGSTAVYYQLYSTNYLNAKTLFTLSLSNDSMAIKFSDSIFVSLANDKISFVGEATE